MFHILLEFAVIDYFLPKYVLALSHICHSYSFYTPFIQFLTGYVKNIIVKATDILMSHKSKFQFLIDMIKTKVEKLFNLVIASSNSL